MTVKIIIKRKFKEAPNLSDVRTINELRINAMRQKGYISGETLVDSVDNRTVAVLSSWTDLEAWETWADSRKRQQLEAKLSLSLREPEKIRSYLLGSSYLIETFEKIAHDVDVAV
jgi:heme-degrading monooxygenase HmoA